jgi:hypothetical protein
MLEWNTVLNALIKDPHRTYYLTGSLFFGGFQASSDIDFFVEQDCEVLEFLTSIGFVTDIRESYGDSSVRSVLTCHSCKPSIHVQVVSDVEKKLYCQEGILKSFGSDSGFSRLSSSTKKRIWSTSMFFMNYPFQREKGKMKV